MLDRVKHDIAVTSKHRSLAQVDWSRQLSREVKPFFVPQPTAESRVQLGTGADKPRRHMGGVDMERASPKPQETRVDARDYTPLLPEQLHPRCGVAIDRAPERKPVFGVPQHQAETVVEVELHPGWGRGKKSSIARATRAPPTPRIDRSDSPPLRVYSAYTPIPTTPAFDSVESRLERPKGGTISRSDERALKPAPEMTPLVIQEQAVRRHNAGVNLSTSTRHFASKSKVSEKYREMFRTPPPPPLSTPDVRRQSPGFAPQRQTGDRSVSALLMTANADLKRAKKIMAQNFAPQSRSPTRTTLLYTPTPTPGPADDGDAAADRR